MHTNQQFFEFQWQVHAGGYEWLETEFPYREAKYLALVPKISGSTLDLPGTRTLPTRQHTALYRDLASAEPTKEGILAFANEHGFLGSTRVHVQSRDGSRELPGELYEYWVREIAMIRFTVDLWDAAREQKLDFLRRHVRWFGDYAVVCARIGKRLTLHVDPAEEITNRVMFTKNDWPGFERFRPGDLIRPALDAVQVAVNNQISASTAHLLWDRHGLQQELCFVPLHLLSAIWMQLAQAIEGNMSYRQCPGCASWFAVAPGKGRADKKFCSSTCRIRAHRDKAV